MKNPLVSNLCASWETFLELIQSRFLLHLKTNLHKSGLVLEQLHLIHMFLLAFWEVTEFGIVPVPVASLETFLLVGDLAAFSC